MAKVNLPLTIDPIKSAQQRSIFDGIYLVSKMERFKGCVEQAQPEALVSIEFTKDAQGLVVLKGSLELNVVLLCQRCNQPFELAINNDFLFTPVKPGADIELVPDEYDIVEMNEHGEINTLSLVEDELMLAIPLVPKHELADCDIRETNQLFGSIPEQEENKVNPFSILQQLKTDKSKQGNK